MESTEPLKVRYDKSKHVGITLDVVPETIKIAGELEDYWEAGKIYTENIDFTVDNDHGCSRHRYNCPDEKCDGYKCLIPTKKTQEGIATFKRFKEKKALFEELDKEIHQILLDINDHSFGSTEIVEFLKKNYDISHKK